MESFYVMFPAIMYILHMEKHKMQKIKTIISTLKNRLKVRNPGCKEDNGGKDREKQQSSKEKVAVK